MSPLTRLVVTLSPFIVACGCATAEKPTPVSAVPSAAVSEAAKSQPVLSPVENPFPPNPPGVYDISKVSVTPVPTSQARPRYPMELRKAGIGGEGVVSFIVGTDGVVRDAVITHATDIRFGEAAVEAVLKWRFRPAQLNGTIVGCHMMVPIVFTLNAE
jgi:TonB family protein